MPPDENSAVIEPQRARRDPILPPLALLVFTPQDLDLFLQAFPQTPGRPHKLFLADIYTRTFDDTPLALAGPVLGAPQAVLVLEKLIALGVRDVLAVGWCGSLLPHVGIGDIVLPCRAISEEGTSQHYPTSIEDPCPSSQLLGLIRDVFEQERVPFHEGPVWSTDAPYRETIGKVVRYRKQGVLAVEMEASALFTVAHFRGVRLALILIVSDDLSTLQWIHGFREARFQKAREKLVELTLGLLCSSVRSLSLSTEPG